MIDVIRVRACFVSGDTRIGEETQGFQCAADAMRQRTAHTGSRCQRDLQLDH